MKEDKEMELMVETVAAKRLNYVQRALERRIRNRSAKVGVIGLGYVGLPLAIEMAVKGFRVTGIDIDGGKVEAVNAGLSYVLDVPNESLFSTVVNGALRATQSFAAVESLDTISICVPTPLRKTKDPDLSYIIAAVEAVHNHLRPGKLIVLESTTYPGTTREVVLPILEKSGFKVGKDFFLASSPERVDPGNKAFTTCTIPKVIGGITPRCTELATLLYQQFVEHTVPVSSPESAEMVKLLENTFRSVNIALANEMAGMCGKLHINVWEVIEAAKSKPFGYMPFYPGPGLGGHCVPIDPFYLTWKAREFELPTRFIELAGEINTAMPRYVVGKLGEALDLRSGKALSQSRILIIGLAYKKNVPDIRESPSLRIIELIEERGGKAEFHDPFVEEIPATREHMPLRGRRSVELTEATLKGFDAILIATDHDVIDYRAIVESAPLVIDTRNVLGRLGLNRSTVIKA